MADAAGTAGAITATVVVLEGVKWAGKILLAKIQANKDAKADRPAQVPPVALLDPRECSKHQGISVGITKLLAATDQIKERLEEFRKDLLELFERMRCVESSQNLLKDHDMKNQEQLSDLDKRMESVGLEIERLKFRKQ
jgi:hypothetical protein